jgi:hypothetical protein
MDFVRRTTLKIPYTARASYALSHRKGKYISPAIHPLESVPSLLSTRPSSHAQAAARVSTPLVAIVQLSVARRTADFHLGMTQCPFLLQIIEVSLPVR